MKRLKTWALILCQVALFLAATGVASKVSSYLLATRYKPGDAPQSHFPVVAVLPQGQETMTGRYRPLRWSQIDEERKKAPGLSFQLPEADGNLTLPDRGRVEPRISFTVLEKTAEGQLIEVIWSDDDYEAHSRYVTDGIALRPQYLRMWGANSMLIGVIPGFICAWLLGWLARRRWPSLGE